jgi:hypothetical protein
MASYEIGYGKPPKSRRFRAGVSGNQRGRPKRKALALAERIKAVLNAPIEYRERGRTKVATHRELSLKMLVDRAINGDLDAAELVLKILVRAERYGDPGLDSVLVENWIAVKPPTRKPVKSRQGATPRLRNGGRRPRNERKGKFAMFVPSTVRTRRISLIQVHLGQLMAHCEWRPHRLLVVGESNRGSWSAISAHCNRRGGLHQGR